MLPYITIKGEFFMGRGASFGTTHETNEIDNKLILLLVSTGSHSELFNK